MDEFDKIFDNCVIPEKKNTGVYYAYEYMVSGLRRFCGADAEWIPEYDKIEAWLEDNNGKGLLCMGEYGRGKTLMCEWIVPSILNNTNRYGYNDVCATMSAYDLAKGLEVPYNRGFLMIDDIGVENISVQYGNRCILFNEIVDDAERYKTVLILTTNLSVEEMEKKYGVRTIDRLMSITTPIVFKGESFRSGKFPRNGIPVRFRAYGVDFGTEEEMIKFRSKQDDYYKGLEEGRYEGNIKDRQEISERQALKMWNGKLCALKKYNWDKIVINK